MKYLALILLIGYATENTELERFRVALSQSEIKHKDIVLSQAVLETGWFGSKLYKDNKNAFGFYYKGEFKSFETVEDCIAYYERWQCKWYKGGDYYEFLNCIYETRKGDCIRYAEDKEYTEKLKKIQKSLRKKQKSS